MAEVDYDNRQVGKSGRWLRANVVATLTAIGIPIIYMLGRAYLTGYWSALGLPGGLMQYEGSDYMYFGFFVLLMPLLFPLESAGGLGFVSILYVALPLAVAVGGWLILSKLLQPTAAKLGGRMDQKIRSWLRVKFVRELSIAFFVAYAATLAMLILFLLGVGLVMPLAGAETLGRKEAAKLRSRYADDSATFSTAFWRTADGVQQEGAVFQCSPLWCIVYSAEQEAFVVLAVSGIDHIAGTPALSTD